MRSVCVPFRQAIAPAEMEAWQLITPDGQVALPEDHPDWDSTIDLSVSRKVVFEGTRLRDECLLSDGALIRLVAGYYSESGRSKRFPWTHDLRLPDRFEGTIDFRIPAVEIATKVDLVVGAVLITPGVERSKAAARIPGSWLWSNRTELRLVQTRGRFPMEWTDFKRSGLPAESPWYLDWPSQDWEAPLLGTLRLRLNATNSAMRDVLELPEADPKRRIIIRAAILDVAKQLVIAGLDSEDFIENHATYPEGSVGFCVRLLISLAFPQTSMKSIRTQLRDHAGEFHMRLQSAIVPFGELG